MPISLNCCNFYEMLVKDFYIQAFANGGCFFNQQTGQDKAFLPSLPHTFPDQ